MRKRPNDSQIRQALIPFVRRAHATSDLKVIEEFAIYGGTCRADVVTLNGASHGYEIAHLSPYRAGAAAWRPCKKALRLMGTRVVFPPTTGERTAW